MGAGALTTEQSAKKEDLLKEVKDGHGTQRWHAIEILHGLAEDPAYKNRLGSKEVLDALAAVLRSKDNDEEARKLATAVSWSLSFGDGVEETMAASDLTKELVNIVAIYQFGKDSHKSSAIEIATVTNACATIWNLLTTESPTNRLLLSDPKFNLLPAIVDLISDPDITTDLLEKSTAILKFLSIESGNRPYMGSQDLLFVPKAVHILSSQNQQPGTPADRYTITTKRHILAALVNISDCSANQVQHCLSLPKYGLLRALRSIIKGRKSALESDPDLVLYACLTAWNMAEKGTTESINAMLPSCIHMSFIDILKEAGPDSSRWSSAWLCPEALNFLMNFATTANGANALRGANLLQVLEAPLLDNTRTNAMNGELLKALFIAVLLVGSAEATRDGYADKLIRTNPQAMDRLLDVFETALAGGSGSDYDSGTFCLKLILQAVCELCGTDANQSLLMRQQRGGGILVLLTRTLEKFAADEPEIPLVGGGGGDVRAATLAAQALLQLTFFRGEACAESKGSDDDDAQLMEVKVKQQFLQPALGLEVLLKVIDQLPSDRFRGEEDVRGYVRSLLRRLHPPPPAVSKPPPPAPTSASPSTPSLSLAATDPTSGLRPAAKRHVMISYAWGARKDLVTQLVAHLRGPRWNFDVWQDTTGSKLVRPMQGSTDDCMATAIEHSHTVIVCISKAYKSSVNCRLECSYAHRRFKQGLLNIYYVMMDPGYTTVSNPDGVDGWLGLYVGDHLWYNLFDERNVENAADDLGMLIQDNMGMGHGLGGTVRRGESSPHLHQQHPDPAT